MLWGLPSDTRGDSPPAPFGLPVSVVVGVWSVVVAAFAFGAVTAEVHGLEWACV